MNGIVRNLDDLGRVVIPKEFRRTMDLKEGDPLDISKDGNRIIISPVSDCCIFCGSDKGLIDLSGRKICTRCAKKISRIFGESGGTK